MEKLKIIIKPTKRWATFYHYHVQDNSQQCKRKNTFPQKIVIGLSSIQVLLLLSNLIIYK